EVQEAYDLMERKEEFGGGGLKLEDELLWGSTWFRRAWKLRIGRSKKYVKLNNGDQVSTSGKRSKKYVKLNNGDQVSTSGKLNDFSEPDTRLTQLRKRRYSRQLIITMTCNTQTTFTTLRTERVIPNIGPSLVPKELSYAGEVENIMKSDKSKGSTLTLLDLYAGCGAILAFVMEHAFLPSCTSSPPPVNNFMNKGEVKEKLKAKRHDLKSLSFVLQRKTKEFTMATKRLKELLEACKSNRDNTKSLQHWLDHEVEVMVNVHEVQHEYEKQG
nr:kinesin-like protein KIN-4A [Tanacetum cinerariifolium]